MNVPELLAMKKHFHPLMQKLESHDAEERIQTLLTLADMAPTLSEQEQRFLLGWLKRLQLDEESDLIVGYMSLIGWLLGDATEERYARHVFCQLETALPIQLRKQLITSFEQT